MTAASYPADHGSLEETAAVDGAPLDILVMPLQAGLSLMVDTGEAVSPLQDPRREDSSEGIVCFPSTSASRGSRWARER